MNISAVPDVPLSQKAKRVVVWGATVEWGMLAAIQMAPLPMEIVTLMRVMKGELREFKVESFFIESKEIPKPEHISEWENDV